MNKKYKSLAVILAILLLLSVGNLEAQSTIQNRWEYVYKEISRPSKPRNILLLLESMDIQENQAELSELYFKILKDQVALVPSWNNEDRATGYNVLIFLVNKMIELQNKDSADIIFIYLTSYPIPSSVKTEAYRALGELGASKYLGAIISRLGDLSRFVNTSSYQQFELAYEALGCIAGIRALEDPQAIPVLFEAANSSFNKSVTDSAWATIDLIDTTDSFSYISSLFESSSSLETISYTLNYIVNSAEYSAEQKNSAALAAIRKNINYQLRMNLREASLRDNTNYIALSQLARNGVDDETAVPDIIKLYEEDKILGNRLLAINVLGVIGGDEASAYLGGLLQQLSRGRRSGGMFIDEEQQLLRQIIYSIEIKSNPINMNNIAAALATSYSDNIKASLLEILAKMQ